MTTRSDRPQIPTPALVVDLAALDRNLARAEAILCGSGLRIRPHVKTHRTPALALRQQRPGSSGVTCATVGEAEVMVSHGLSDVLLANEIATPAKIERLVALAEHTTITAAVDSAELVHSYAAAAARRNGITLRLLVDVDTGLQRCGVTSTAQAVALARLIEDTPHVALAGLMGYEGRLRTGPERATAVSDARATLRECATGFQHAGLSLDVVSVGGTSTMRDWQGEGFVTEIQAGSYAFMEHDLDGLGLPFESAAWVRATVISMHGQRAVVDAGRKSIGCEYGPPRAIGIDASVCSVSEEHCVLAGHAVKTLTRGQVIRLRPSQIRTTFNLHDSVWLKDGQGLYVSAPVAARGAST